MKQQTLFIQFKGKLIPMNSKSSTHLFKINYQLQSSYDSQKLLATIKNIFCQRKDHCCMKCPQILREKIYCYFPQNTMEIICRRQCLWKMSTNNITLDYHKYHHFQREKLIIIQGHFFIKIRWHQEYMFLYAGKFMPGMEKLAGPKLSRILYTC